MTEQLQTLLATLVLSCISFQAYALTLVHGDEVLEIAQYKIVADADYSHQMYSPFRGHQVLFEGYRLNDFFIRHLGVSVEQATFHALDGYVYQISDITNGSWMLVTKEDGQTLNIRNHGPLRLIETEIDREAAKNISLFDHWVWMIDRIVVDD